MEIEPVGVVTHISTRKRVMWHTTHLFLLLRDTSRFLLHAVDLLQEQIQSRCKTNAFTFRELNLEGV